MVIKKYKKQDEVSYTLGTTLTIELLHNKIDKVIRVFVHSNIIKNETYYYIERICNKNNISIEYNDKTFNILSEKENCYIIGEFLKYTDPLHQEESHVVLVNPSNAGNLGTIIRTAIGFGINNIAIIKPGVDIFDPHVIRASMGAFFHIKFEYFESFPDYLKAVSKRDIFLFMLKGSISLSLVKAGDIYSLVFGNEATGLSEEYLSYGQSVIIKHTNDIDSLNLPIAVSIALYEVTKNDF